MIKSKENDSAVKSLPNKKKGRKLLSILVVIILISSIFLYLNLTNYLPFLSQTKQPVGNVKPINTQRYIEEYPEIAEMPNLDKINYNAWKTDATIEQIVDSYKQDLLEDGFDIKYENTLLFGGKEYRVLGLLKGLTAVGILVSLDSDYTDDYESEVLYVTGSALDFKEILDWYNSK